jgi:hypothetical protein
MCIGASCAALINVCNSAAIAPSPANSQNRDRYTENVLSSNSPNESGRIAYTAAVPDPARAGIPIGIPTVAGDSHSCGVICPFSSALAGLPSPTQPNFSFKRFREE